MVSFADEVRNDLLALVRERGFHTRLWSETVTGSGPRPDIIQQSQLCLAVRQSNIRRWSPWQGDDSDALLTFLAGPFPGITTIMNRGFFVDFLEIAPGSELKPEGQYGFTERWNVVQCRDRRIDGEIVAFTALVRR